jgi:hypothetical protein
MAKTKPLMAAVSKKSLRVTVPDFPKTPEKTRMQKAIEELKQKNSFPSSLSFYDMRERFNRYEYAGSIDFDPPKKVQIFQATTNNMDNNGVADIKRSDYFTGYKLNKFKWVENLTNPIHLFVIETEKETTLTQVIDYDAETGTIVCHHWNITYNDTDINISDVRNIYVVEAYSNEMILQVS